MTINSNKIQEGTIIFWNKVYGFIQISSEYSIFFHKSSVLLLNESNLNLLDKVSFQVSNATNGRHQGKEIAINVEKTGNFDLQDYDRFVGKIIKWNGKTGEIISPPQKKHIIFFSTRKLYDIDLFKKDDLVVFNQVISNKNPDQLFALFAYPINREKDIIFLQQAYFDCKFSDIENYIDKLILEQNYYTDFELFELKLLRLGKIDSQKSFLKLVSLINESSKRNFCPPYSLLKVYCTEIYLIQLWEMKLIPEIDIKIIKEYFHNTNSENKRIIILKLSEIEKFEVLENHFEKLILEGYLFNINNNLKTLLDITFRDEKSRCIEIYNKVKTLLFKELNNNELVFLWLNGYIDKIDERIIVENFDINVSSNLKLLFSNKTEKNIDIVKNIFENYFFELSQIDFNDNFPIIVIRFINFNTFFKDRFKEIINDIITRFNNYQKFILWVFNVPFKFDAFDYLDKNYLDINDFYKIKFFIHKSTDLKKTLNLNLLNKVNINEINLINYIYQNPWNELIHPTEIFPSDKSNCYFLLDLLNFIEKYKLENIDIENISLSIFNSLPKYKVHHLRLWLYDYVINKYDYVGFRSSYNLLNSIEKKIFKHKLNDVIYHEDVVMPEFLEVIPCNLIINKTEFSTIYDAKIENIYFENNKFKLRTENELYTEYYIEKYSSSGFNRIPSNDILNNFEIVIEVSNENKIINVSGLEEIFTQIHTDSIKRSSGGSLVNKKSRKVEESYVENWELRKEIITYLENNQTKNFNSKSVWEPKNRFRRLDEYSGIDSLELTRLFTIDTKDGYGIVWENIDLMDDRATYVFKSNFESITTQISKIANSIVNYAQFRSSLLSVSKSKETKTFKSNLGLIGTIRNERGGNNSFEKWLDKLNKHLSEDIPNIPSDEELSTIENWKSETGNSKATGKKWETGVVNGKSINDVKVKNIPLDPSKNEINNIEKNNNLELQKKQEILTALKTFNSQFLENFKY